MRAEAKSFFLATRFLRRPKREAVEAIYALFRTADNLADEPEFDDAQRRDGLSTIDRTLKRIRDPACVCKAPWFPAVRRAFARFPIAIEDASRLIDACRRDVDGITCETMDDLERYAAAIAGTVGRCSMPILGASDSDSLDRAERLGIALQLTNILRDREADRAIGREYLPRSTPAKPEAELLRDVARRAHIYYREASVLAPRLPNDGSRVALLAASNLYEGVLDDLERRNFDSRGRAQLSGFEKLRRMLRSVNAAFRGRGRVTS